MRAPRGLRMTDPWKQSGVKRARVVELCIPGCGQTLSGGAKGLREGRLRLRRPHGELSVSRQAVRMCVRLVGAAARTDRIR